jgi:DNA mismatch endonuclease (patch repair protein)
MADVHTKEVRSYNMSRIRNKNTKPEILVRKFLHANGYRFRLHVENMPRKPDIVLPKYKTVIFVHGCFWHGHKKCKKAPIPKTNTNWWVEKISLNKVKDSQASELLKSQGWRVVTLWQCELKGDSWKPKLLELIGKERK